MSSEWNIIGEEGFDSLDSYAVELVAVVVGVVDYCNDSPMAMMIT